jgi:hypothetical protein
VREVHEPPDCATGACEVELGAEEPEELAAEDDDVDVDERAFVAEPELGVEPALEVECVACSPSAPAITAAPAAAAAAMRRVMSRAARSPRSRCVP